MPFANHYRMTATGRVGNDTDERFSWSLNFVNNNQPDFDEPSWFNNLADQFDDMAADVVAFHERTSSRISQVCVLEEVKFAAIGTDGKYRNRTPYIVNVPDVAGGAGFDIAKWCPPQAAIAASLVTDRNDPTGRGRFYIPCTVVELTTGYQMTTAHAEGLRASVVQLLNDLNNDPNVDGIGPGGTQIVVASSKGYNSPVTGVKIGRVVDTMRSRRKQLQEAYTGVTSLS